MILIKIFLGLSIHWWLIFYLICPDGYKIMIFFCIYQPAFTFSYKQVPSILLHLFMCLITCNCWYECEFLFLNDLNFLAVIYYFSVQAVVNLTGHIPFKLAPSSLWRFGETWGGGAGRAFAFVLTQQDILLLPLSQP